LPTTVVKGATVYCKGSYYYLIDAATVHYFLGESHEPWMWNYLKSLKDNDVFVDVGAHIGLYSIYVARISKRGKVIAIEPHPENFQFLLLNIKLNKLRNVIALNLVAWKENVELPLYIADSSGGHTLKPTTARKRVVSIRGRRLDDIIGELGISKVSFVKIDVEGAEVEVLEGLRNTLRIHRPKLMVEVWKDNAGAVRRFLEDLNYSIQKVSESISKDFCYIYATSSLK